MNPDMLLAMAGIADVELGVTGEAALETAAAEFLRAGGVVSMTDWLLACATSRAALTAAALKVQAERAMAVAEALEARLVAAGDGMEVDAVLDKMHRAAAK